MMIDAISTTRALPWPHHLPRQRTRRLAPGTRGRAAARHGLRAALQSLCLSAAVMAAAGALGASRGPVELQAPVPAQQHTAAQMPIVEVASVGLARSVLPR